MERKQDQKTKGLSRRWLVTSGGWRDQQQVKRGGKVGRFESGKVGRREEVWDPEAGRVGGI